MDFYFSRNPNPRVKGTACSLPPQIQPLTMSTFHAMHTKVSEADGFLAALDQSGGSTPKALKLYGIPDSVRVHVFVSIQNSSAADFAFHTKFFQQIHNSLIIFPLSTFLLPMYMMFRNMSRATIACTMQFTECAAASSRAPVLLVTR
jgi:hypothetical protein